MQAQPNAYPNPVTRGVLAYALGIFCMALVDASGKHLSRAYPLAEIIFFRSVLAAVPLGIAAGRAGWSTLRTRHPVLHVVRGLTVLFTLGLFFWSLRYLPLADATALNLTSPIFTTLFAAWFLAESIPRRYWLALLIGMAGVWLVMAPTDATLRVVALIAVASAAAYAGTNIVTRILVRTDSSLCCTFHSNTVLLAVTAFAALAHDWLPFTWRDGAVVFVMAIASTALQMLAGYALKRVPASRLAPLDYTLLIWTVGIGALVWHEWPRPAVWAGMVLVCASCWVIVRSKAVRPAPVSSAKPETLA
ncbi:DMT family transporter [Trinickia caryophylli]|uniref:Permease of the drug/metabolite transporter (DMT) superfamily n=1 Tax=Trinickia caryophylli TaxID=28094 RepID=A0A1X7DI28_TRICW|nr:DMT family transporter [Trinickia caryophylli]WQE12288.1 DMT family transporter [Trinickia caryophylli]GLU31566.1 DMT transporter permease [Trinickia caryophylli]SMF15419.1 Permease of the drug/metabolite transporter (DMT) superfamily [Trinickia caryophylli]